MQPRTFSVLALAASLALPAAVTAQNAADTPTPDVVVKRALEAAGGLDTFSNLGILGLSITTEETAQAGAQAKSSMKLYVKTPGPTPARMEISGSPVVSGDNGETGWAAANGEPDPRPSTTYMIKRMLRSRLFPLLLPFSLTWEEVSVVGMEATSVGKVPVWRLRVLLTKTFFHTPQIATQWVIDVDRKTYAVVLAQCPATDLGRGIKADGMMFSWNKPQNLRGVVLPGEQHVVGLSETGAIKAHNRADTITYEFVDSARAASLFNDPTPPGKRKAPQVGPQTVKPKAQS